jgi:hypothetical protein
MLATMLSGFRETSFDDFFYALSAEPLDTHIRCIQILGTVKSKFLVIASQSHCEIATSSTNQNSHVKETTTREFS